jgi:spore coat polysaccharide biosynthesis protein SpsF
MLDGAVVVLQARMGSARLPGKAMARLAGTTVVGRCLDRLLAGRTAPVVLATTTSREDDVLAQEATERGVPSVRGPVDDVLKRFVMVVSSLGARYVVRATGDNPAVDMDAPARVLRILDESGSDYVTECGLPYGTAVEAVTADALTRVDQEAQDPADREHVTAFVKRARHRFRVVEKLAPPDLRRPDLRLTIDTDEDLQFMSRVFARSASAEPPLRTLIAAADRVLREAVRS